MGRTQEEPCLSTISSSVNSDHTSSSSLSTVRPVLKSILKPSTSAADKPTVEDVTEESSSEDEEEDSHAEEDEEASDDDSIVPIKEDLEGSEQSDQDEEDEDGENETEPPIVGKKRAHVQIVTNEEEESEENDDDTNKSHKSEQPVEESIALTEAQD